MLKLRSKITQSVLRYFFLHDKKEVHVNELARRLHLDNGNSARKLIELQEEGILKSRWQGNQKCYSLNRAFPLFKEYKKIFDRSFGFEEVLRGALKNLKGIQKVVIFGSYAQKTMDPQSDIDILVIGKHDTIDLQRKIAQLQRDVDREINVISLTPKEYDQKKKTDAFLESLHAKKHIQIL